MLTNAATPDGYYVNSDGVWLNNSTAQQLIPNWVGKYMASDGQVITVAGSDAEGVTLTFYGCGEEGWYTWDYQLTYLDAEKTQVTDNDKNYLGEILQGTVYTLTEKGIEVTVEPVVAGKWEHI